jgi:hypothetical protein
MFRGGTLHFLMSSLDAWDDFELMLWYEEREKGYVVSNGSVDSGGRLRTSPAKGVPRGRPRLFQPTPMLKFADLARLSTHSGGENRVEVAILCMLGLELPLLDDSTRRNPFSSCDSRNPGAKMTFSRIRFKGVATVFANFLDLYLRSTFEWRTINWQSGDH